MVHIPYLASGRLLLLTMKWVCANIRQLLKLLVDWRAGHAPLPVTLVQFDTPPERARWTSLFQRTLDGEMTPEQYLIASGFDARDTNDKWAHRKRNWATRQFDGRLVARKDFQIQHRGASEWSLCSISVISSGARAVAKKQTLNNM